MNNIKKVMPKRLLSFLLAVVMLLGVLPLSAVPVGAAGETHPTVVGNLDGSKMGYYTNKGVLKTVPASDFSGTNAEQKWLNFKRTYAVKSDVAGMVFYDPPSGTVYVNGAVRNIAFATKTDDDDVLNIVVDGDSSIEDPIYGYNGEDGKGLAKLSIIFRNNAVLTLTGGNDTLPIKIGILDVSWTEKKNGNTVYHGAGDLELKGTGKLKITAPDDIAVFYGINAKNIYISDNASLDIKMGITVRHATGDYDAAIGCRSLNINTTGTVNVDVSEVMNPNSTPVSGRYINAVSFVGGNGFNLTKAKRVSFKAVTKRSIFVDFEGDYDSTWYDAIKKNLEAKDWVITESQGDAATPYEMIFTNKNNRPAPDMVTSFTANADLKEATALKQGQAKFTWVEIYSDSNKWDPNAYNVITANVKCELVDANIAKRIGYNSGNPSVTSESLLSDLKIKLKSSDMYYRPSSGTVDFSLTGNEIGPSNIGKGTFRYLLTVEAYFNDTYYFDGAGVSFAKVYGSIGTGGTKDNWLAVRPSGIVIYPETENYYVDPLAKLKLVVDSQIGTEFTNTNNAPDGYYVQNYPDRHVVNFRRIHMPNTDLEIELKRNTVLHLGKYYRQDLVKSYEANIYADNLTVRGDGVLLASNYANSSGGYTGAAIRANSVTFFGSNLTVDLKRDNDKSCISVPTPSDFKPVNAKSIVLSAKSGNWVDGVANNETDMRKYFGAYWDLYNVTQSNGSKTVTFGRTPAELSDPILSVGGNEYRKGEAVSDYTAGSGNDKFSVEFTLGPKWAARLSNYNQIRSNAVIEVWEDGLYQGKLTVNEQYNYSHEGVVEYTLSAPDIKLKAGHLYSVYCYMMPYSGNTKLADGKSAKWSFFVSDGNSANVISQAPLVQNGGDLRPDIDYGTPGTNNTIAANNAKFKVASQTDWGGKFNGNYMIAGEEYEKTVTLQAKGSYRFNSYCDVTLDSQNTEIVHTEVSTDRRSVTVYLRSTCVTVIETVTGTLTGFYIGDCQYSADVIPAEPDKYELKIAYIATRLSEDDFEEETYLKSNAAYVIAVEVYPKPGYIFKNVNLIVNMDDGVHTVPTVYKRNVQIDLAYLVGDFYETAELCYAAPHLFDRLDIVINEPTAGESATGEAYTTAEIVQDGLDVKEVYWEKDRKKFTGTFQAGESYHYTVAVECPDYLRPGDKFTVYVNGKEAYNDYFDYDTKPGWIYIWADGPMTASEPFGSTLSGNITSFGSESDDVIVQLIENGASEASYEAVVQGNNAAYSINDIAPGEYTLRVMKKNHVTEEYDVTIGTDNMTQDVKMYLLGDVNGDGEVGMKDIVMLIRFLSAWDVTVIEKAADMNSDSTLGMVDLILLIRATV